MGKNPRTLAIPISERNSKYLKDQNADLRQFAVDEMDEFEFFVLRLLVSAGDFRVQRLLLALQQILKPNLHIA